jgi:hypothetical protein
MLWVGLIGEAEASLRNCILFTLSENLIAESSTPATQNLTLHDVSYEAVLQKLDTISLLSQSLHEDLRHKAQRRKSQER